MKSILTVSKRRLPLLFTLLVTLVLALGLSAMWTSPAVVAHTLFDSPPPTPPANDNLASATVIAAVPFNDVVDITQATSESGEPLPCGGYTPPRTVWYAFTPPERMLLRANMDGSSFWDPVLNLYQTTSATPGFADLGYMDCFAYGNTVQFWVEAGVTYYFQATDMWSGGGSLHFNLEQVLPPANDNFANATPVGGLPFSSSVDATTATLEAGEPVPSCAQWYGPSGTIWYAFTPSTTQSLTAYASGSNPFEAAYTGASLGNLQQVACREWGGPMTFRAEAGVTYYFQVGNLYNQTSGLNFSLDVTPPPYVSFYYWPGDPTEYDTVGFNANCYDPIGMGIEKQLWDLGDGTTAEGCCPNHRYARDGDYTAALTCTTPDGRSGTSTQTIAVRTHDVAITRLTAPQSASVGQTRSIAVNVNSKRYVENIQVQLFKSVPGGYQLVGTLNQQVPVRPSNRTTAFAFSYTFTKDDAVMGKVTFRATASIMDARDALPADNEAIAPPTKVTK
jgi:hypothetical protein